MTVAPVPRAFIRRRLHSLMGLWLVLFLLEHLLTNSQAALWLGEEGRGFVRMVNALHNLPYLRVVEVFLLGVPLLMHMVWGVKYALEAKGNAKRSDGSVPSLPQYGRNRAYTWQRVTSWILLIGLVVHVVEFRFLNYPKEVARGVERVYVVELHHDAGLYVLAPRLGVKLSNQGQWVKAESPDFGTATLLTVRDTFKSPVAVAFYTIFVLAACFHACNGFWTFLLSWGIVIRRCAQRSFLTLSLVLMGLLAFLGLASIFGTWWTITN